MALDPQRTLDLSEAESQKRSKKGQHMGGKWSWSTEKHIPSDLVVGFFGETEKFWALGHLPLTTQ
jgi:hypothetical protein